MTDTPPPLSIVWAKLRQSLGVCNRTILLVSAWRKNAEPTVRKPLQRCNTKRGTQGTAYPFGAANLLNVLMNSRDFTLTLSVPFSQNWRPNAH